MQDQPIANLFEEYELVAASGWFDASFYVRTNPDIARLNIDPLTHYLETGERAGRAPSDRFDIAHYRAQCSALGPLAGSALYHFLTVGQQHGLTPAPGVTPTHIGQTTSRIRHQICIDIPRIVGGALDAPLRAGLSIAGWALADDAITQIDVAVDGNRIATARMGLRRPDVAATYAGVANALMSGFAAHLPAKTFTPGPHEVSVSSILGSGETATVRFKLEAQGMDEGRGPWSLRRKMSQAEVNLSLGLLNRLDWHPKFAIFLPMPVNDAEVSPARLTVESIRAQGYEHWSVHVVPANSARAREQSNRQAKLLRGFDDIAAKLVIETNSKRAPPVEPRLAGEKGKLFAIYCSPGDELGCDALLEWAVASGLDQTADFLYCDDRRPGAADELGGPFFKPAWSPDLLLSMNYIGRAYCVDVNLLDSLAYQKAVTRLRNYDAVLRLTEVAQCIRHVPKVLYQEGDTARTQVAEKKALADACSRRRLDATVETGFGPGHYRVKRTSAAGRVSIIIPTRAAGGLIKTCLETLHDLTRYRDFEVLCIENIAPAEKRWKRWIRRQADLVLDAPAVFNWSRYNNLTAAQATGNYFLFLNDDTEIIDPDWLESLVEHAARPEVGVVGPLLLYPDRTIQQAGVMLDDAGRGRHAFRHLPPGDGGYFGLALTQRNVISVTGAALMTRRETFEVLRGFDEAHPIINNDLDFCLRAWRHGLLNVYTPHSRVVHHEMASRQHVEDAYNSAAFKISWQKLIALGDPYFNPNLSRHDEQFRIEREPVEVVVAARPLFARGSIRRILVVKLDHIGDCITALPAVRRLKLHFPSATISVMAAKGTFPIWKSVSIVNDLIPFDLFHARSGLGKIDVSTAQFDELRRDLTDRRFDLAVDLRKQPDSRHVLQYSGARILAGFDHQNRYPWLDIAPEWDEDVPLRAKHAHVSQDLIALVDAIDANADSCEAPHEWLGESGLSLTAGEHKNLFSKPLICIHPAAGSAMRQWPLSRFAELIELFLQTGAYNVALVGGPDEASLTRDIFAGNALRKKVFSLVGRLGLAELPALLKRAVLFVGNNSGPQHLAASLNVPTVGIHSGVVDAREWGPAGTRAVAVRREMSCSPCFIEFPKDCPRGLACLNDLSAGAVYRACQRLLEVREELQSATSF